MDKEWELTPLLFIALLVFDNGRRLLSAESQSETADGMLRSQCTKIRKQRGLSCRYVVVARRSLLAYLQQRERGLSWCATPTKVETRATLYSSEILATVDFHAA